jgi:integrase
MQTLYTLWDRNRRQFIPMSDICRFAITSAMRLSEITSLRWIDLDSEKRTVIIRNRKDPRRKQGNDQRVPLFDEAWALVNRQHKRSDRIFPYDPRSVSAAFTRGVAACGIEDLRFHDLRHEGASRLFERGFQIEQVALITGHKDWGMLRRYTQLKPEDLHNV